MGGLYSPNEARMREGLKRVEYGDEPRVQAQNLPLSAVGQMPEMPSTPETPPVPQAGPEPTPEERAFIAEKQLRQLIAD